jgi:hypothetical protein
MTVVYAAPADAAENINGQVLGAGVPIASSTVTLWAASTDAPKQLAQTRTGADGRFAISGVEHVTRFPASDPSKVENFRTGINNSGLGAPQIGPARPY